ncbi:hypothetical protein [Pantoea sp. OXWO6B1]|uniref:hypothetical protein n=1 Tax=Pantoea sp. OXWO6B1 TaxID=1835724 RepID=UPI0007C866C9|nr:hypothetical protein [Pantoea sp. OXWO6B1]OAD97984.1 hypothetical protein A6A26_23800 [Pantoea sp. OXWO6B1]
MAQGLGYGTSISFGALTSGNADFAQAYIHVIGDNGTSQVWYFKPHDGDSIAGGGNIVAGTEVH